MQVNKHSVEEVVKLFDDELVVLRIQIEEIEDTIKDLRTLVVSLIQNKEGERKWEVKKR